MNGLTTKLRSTKKLQIVFVLFLSVSASVARAQVDQHNPYAPDDYYEACSQCSIQLDDAIKDLELARSQRVLPEWYQNPWAIIGLSLVTGFVGYEIGVNQ